MARARPFRPDDPRQARIEKSFSSAAERADHTTSSLNAGPALPIRRLRRAHAGNALHSGGRLAGSGPGVGRVEYSSRGRDGDIAPVKRVQRFSGFFRFGGLSSLGSLSSLSS